MHKNTCILYMYCMYFVHVLYVFCTCIVCILYMYCMYFVHVLYVFLCSYSSRFIGSFMYVLSVCFSLSSFLKIIDSFEGLLGPAPPTRLIMATDNRLRKQIQEQSTRFQKVPPTQLINYLLTTY